MAFYKHNIRTVFVCFCLLLASTAAANTSGHYQQQYTQLQSIQQQIDAQTNQIETLQQNLNEKGDEISKLKKSKDLSFFQQLQLQKYMQEAQSLSVNLDQKYQKKSQMEDQFSKLQKSLIRSIESDLSKAHLLEKEQTKSLMTLHQNVSHLGKTPAQKANQTLTLSTQNSSEHSLEQWIVLQDLQIYTQDLIEETKQELAYEKQQVLLTKELSHLMNEEMFFSEQGFIQGTARKQQPTSDIAVTSKEGAQNPTTPTETPETPTDPAPTDPEPTPDTPADPNIDPSTDISVDADISTPSTIDEIDPKVQSLMMDNIFPEVPSSSGQLDITSHHNESGRSDFYENPNDFTNVLASLAPQKGETKEEFLTRKIQYLQSILHKLQTSASEAKKDFERSHINE